jgi:hypothetical protein
MKAHIEVLCGRAASDRRRYFVWMLDAFFGAGGESFYAVVDDFGNLVRVPS